ncbi:MAG: hypothetical protein EA417_05755 [Gammaproteobacteria bacterium]|nr:MAG: hypothetical protein EA417_05755 [Gammaproteobacteria bacterium]
MQTWGALIAGRAAVSEGQGDCMILRVILAFLAAVVLSAALAAAASTQFVLAELARLDVAFTLGDRVAMTMHDIVGMASLYLPIFGLGLLIAFSVAALVIRFLLPGWSVLGFTLAGFTAVVAIMGVAMLMFGLMPVAGARSLGGMMTQGMAGAAGGYLFARLVARPAATSVSVAASPAVSKKA